MTTGLEIAALTKLLSPLVMELYKGAKTSSIKGFSKWQVNGFANKLAKKLALADKIKTIWSPDK